ncbi:MAG: DNA-binding protein [Clostridia bacterium]|nr:DNA-binding protein [Clostridia bacterium]
MALKRIRTIKEALQLIKKEDCETAITEHFIRQLCKNNKIKCFSSGNKILLDFDDLISKLSGG